MSRNILMTGAAFGIIAIVLGAFAAHGLEALLSADSLDTFETGVRYQMYMSLFLLLLGALPVVSEGIRKVCFYLTMAGILLFSGSIYLLATNSLTSFDYTVIAMATPIGGLLMISAWALLMIGFSKLKKK